MQCALPGVWSCQPAVLCAQLVRVWTGCNMSTRRLLALSIQPMTHDMLSCLRIKYAAGQASGLGVEY